MPLFATIVAAAVTLSTAAVSADPPAWTEPQRPFEIVGPIRYVGSKGLAAYLIDTSAGLILIDGTLEANAPMIERNIVRLGYRLSDVKLLLVSHAHFDHAGGLARLKQDTGARLLASARDRPALESGRPIGETSYGIVGFPAVRVDGVVRDGQPLRLGRVTMTPTLTPGHTAGCTTWSTDVVERGRTLRVVFPCSVTVAGNRLIGNREYPGIVGDFRATFATMARMRADVILPAHPEAADVIARGARHAAGERDAFLMPDALAKLVAQSRSAFEATLVKERAAARVQPRRR